MTANDVLLNDTPVDHAAISAPTEGTTFTTGETHTFTGSDAEDSDVTVNLAWESDRDGLIGTGGSLVSTKFNVEGSMPNMF